MADDPATSGDVVVDSDVDLHDPAQRAELRRHGWPVLGVIAVGGALGALARHGLNELMLPLWSTFSINVTGCLLIGVLMTTRWSSSRLVRPFLGVGVLGGFTTFSAYALDIRTTLTAGRPWSALLYLVGTLVCALAAVWLGTVITPRSLR